MTQIKKKQNLPGYKVIGIKPEPQELCFPKQNSHEIGLLIWNGTFNLTLENSRILNYLYLKNESFLCVFAFMQVPMCVHMCTHVEANLKGPFLGTILLVLLRQGLTGATH